MPDIIIPFGNAGQHAQVKFIEIGDGTHALQAVLVDPATGEPYSTFRGPEYPNWVTIPWVNNQVFSASPPPPLVLTQADMRAARVGALSLYAIVPGALNPADAVPPNEARVLSVSLEAQYVPGGAWIREAFYSYLIGDSNPESNDPVDLGRPRPAVRLRVSWEQNSDGFNPFGYPITLMLIRPA